MGFPTAVPFQAALAGASDAVIAVIDGGPPCTYTVSPSELSFSTLGGNAEVSATTSPGCNWSATKAGYWIDVSTPLIRTGSGTVVVSVSPNPGGRSTKGALVIAGRGVSVDQSDGCDYTLSSQGQNAFAEGGEGSFQIETQDGCTATAVSNVPWITIISGANTTGTATVTFRVDPNTTVFPRTGTITAAGLTHTVGQFLAHCNVTLIDSFTGANAAGGSGSFDVVVNPTSCTWTVSSVDWITITSTPSGVGNGKVTFSIAPNPGAFRQGEIVVAGQSHLVQQAGETSGLRFQTVSPCRVLDTRLDDGPLGGPSLNSGTTREVPVTKSLCGIPSQAVAYAVNVTVVPKGGLSYLTLWPTGKAQPLASTLNSFDGRVKANAAIVPAGVDGNISIFVTDSTDVVIDISGYFLYSTSLSEPKFYPLPPCRVADTRLSPGHFGGPSLASGQGRSFTIPNSNCGVPAHAQAYSLNITAVPAEPLAYLTAWPSGHSQPFVSTLNAFKGEVTANAAIVPAGVSGFVTGRTDVIIDINGYFAPPGDTATGLLFYSLTPCGVTDTRNAHGPLGGPAMAPGESRNLPVASAACGLQPNAQAYSLNATVVPAEPLAYLTMWPTGQAQPVVSTLNSFDASVVANAAIVPGTGGSITAFVTNLTDLILDVNGYFAP